MCMFVPFILFSGYGGQQSVRSGPWKAIRTSMGKGNLEIELYNLSEDPGEQTDVADRLPPQGSRGWVRGYIDLR